MSDLLTKKAKAPSIDELWNAVERSLNDASKAFPVLQTMLKHATNGRGSTVDLRGAVMVADEMIANIGYAIKALPALRALKDEPEGWVSVPKEPTEAMWYGLARDIVMWRDLQNPTGTALYKHLDNCGRDAPAWLRNEIHDKDYVPPKGTVAACIYKAMLSAAPSAET
jgi:hypothetical protein